MRPVAILFLVFSLSGIAGIIYESIWSHYLKLFLGHAAYAQTIVLILFMGGMATGSWLGSRLEKRVTDSLRAYVLIEIAIGVLAFAFHPVYVAVTDFALLRLFPHLADANSIAVAKFLLSAALLLPQSILLGMTFPFMAVGALQRRLLPPGFTISNLYFVNSLGAAIGVLLSGFLLIAWFGLPGTIAVAGSLNLLIALTVLVLARSIPLAPGDAATTAPRSPDGDAPGVLPLILAAALLTGAASFIYEITWVRMLNMVLGTSTHSFELMLSAFIFGLAIGGRWIRRHLDGATDLLSLLGFIQLAMAVCALATLAFYDFSFILMSTIFYSVATTPVGYFLFMLLSSGLVIFIMLPATICAGMTLPLMTQILLQRGHGNRSVGEVYAANTIGAIIGVVLAVHVLIPLFSLKAALVCGGLVDLLLGAWLLRRYVPRADVSAARAAGVGAAAFALVVIFFIDLDPRKMASSVFRGGATEIGADTIVNRHRDGKTASVTVSTRNGSHRAIATNGKTDASIELDMSRPASTDESTQVLTAALPLMLKPGATNAAVIGFGSGMTTHALLQSAALTRVDTIEIEREMVEGSRLYLPHVAATYTDPRSAIHIDDARTYFASRQAHYDLILSEPSNPWVSGIAGLFSVEFYTLVARHLAADGVFAQWLQLYEIDLSLMATVFKAFGQVFPDYRVYELGDGNLLLLAGPGAAAPPQPATVLAMGDMAALLERVGITTPAALASRYVAGAALLAPLFAGFDLPANSDFYPVLDLNAAYQRFLGADSKRFSDFVRADLPVLGMLGDRAHTIEGIDPVADRDYRTLERLAHARILEAYVLHDRVAALDQLPPTLALAASQARGPARPPCSSAAGRALWRHALLEIATATLAFVPPATGAAMLDRLVQADCVTGGGADWVALLRAVAARDPDGLLAAATRLLDNADADLLERRRELVVGAWLLGNVAGGGLQDSSAMWLSLDTEERDKLLESMTIRLLLAHAGVPHQGRRP